MLAFIFFTSFLTLASESQVTELVSTDPASSLESESESAVDPTPPPPVDPVSLISNPDNKAAGIELRSSVIKAQGDEIVRRLDVYPRLSCEEFLADLPFADGATTPFVSALGTIQRYASALRARMPTDCFNRLLQDLATVQNPAVDRIIMELSTNPPEQYLSRAVRYCAEPASGIEEILRLGNNVQVINNCAPLRPGQWKPVSGRTASNHPYDYGLVSEGFNRVRAVLSVEFTGTSDNVTGEMMLERSRSCLNSIQGSLRGPRGEELSISLLTENELRAMPRNLRPSTTSITIAPENARSHSLAYASSIDCPVILHEVLHLLGLCDEYPGDHDTYACRAVGARDSVMRDQNLTFGTAVPENIRCQCNTDECSEVLSDPIKRDLVISPIYSDVIDWRFRVAHCTTSSTIIGYFNTTPNPSSYSAQLSDPRTLNVVSAFNPSSNGFEQTTLRCECPEGDQDCINQLATFVTPPPNLRPRFCPMNTKLISSTVGGPPAANQFSDGVLQFHRPATRASLLEPYHFNRIMAGSCVEQVTNYEECARYAYQSNMESCSEVPARCLRSTDWGNQ